MPCKSKSTNPDGTACIDITKCRSARFPEETPLIRELYREWALASAANGKTALAARCHAAAGDAGAAATALSKIAEPGALFAAAKLTLGVAGEEEKARLFAVQGS